MLPHFRYKRCKASFRMIIQIMINTMILNLFHSRCSWLNVYCRRWPEFKSWKRQFTFLIALIQLRKVPIKQFFLQQRVNSRANCALLHWRCNWPRRKKILCPNLLNSAWKIDLGSHPVRLEGLGKYIFATDFSPNSVNIFIQNSIEMLIKRFFSFLFFFFFARKYFTVFLRYQYLTFVDFIFINDISDDIKSEIYLFTDDIKLLVRPLSKEIGQMILNKLSFWKDIQKIKFNIENVKCNIVDPKTIKLNIN